MVELRSKVAFTC